MICWSVSGMRDALEKRAIWIRAGRLGKRLVFVRKMKEDDEEDEEVVMKVEVLFVTGDFVVAGDDEVVKPSFPFEFLLS